MIKIIQFDKKYYDKVCELFINVYSEPNTIRQWDLETTKKHLH